MLGLIIISYQLFTKVFISLTLLLSSRGGWVVQVVALKSSKTASQDQIQLRDKKSWWHHIVDPLNLLISGEELHRVCCAPSWKSFSWVLSKISPTMTSLLSQRRQFGLNCKKIIALKIAYKIVAFFAESYPLVKSPMNKNILNS